MKHFDDFDDFDNIGCFDIDKLDDELDGTLLYAHDIVKLINSHYTTHQLRQVLRSNAITATTFSQWVNDGKLPFIVPKGAKRKMYRWADIKKSMDFHIYQGRSSVPNLIAKEIKAKEKAKLSSSDVDNGEVELFDDYLEQLEEELEACITPTERANVADKFWSAKFKEFKLKAQMGEYIELDKVGNVLNLLLPNLRDKLFKISPTVAQQHPTAPPELIQTIHDAVNLALTELQISLGNDEVGQVADNFIQKRSKDDFTPFDNTHAIEVVDEYESEDK